MAGRIRLEQVLVNLLQNALDAVGGREEPAVTIGVREDGETVSITVTDNGPGVSPAAREQLFMPFNTTKATGLGLGVDAAGSAQGEHGLLEPHRPIVGRIVGPIVDRTPGRIAGMYDVQALRAHFPSLASGTAYFDGPGGSQVPASVVDAMSAYLTEANANLGGAFATSRASDAVMERGRAAAADFAGAEPEGIAFGANMTTLNFQLAHAVARTLEPGDEIVVTALDHDANVAPWLLVAELISRSGQPLSRLVGDRMAAFPSSGEINFRLSDPDAALARVLAAMEPAAIARDDTDGISLEYPDWRFNLRRSNTEPVVRLNVESRGDAALVAAKVAEISALLAG